MKNTSVGFCCITNYVKSLVVSTNLCVFPSGFCGQYFKQGSAGGSSVALGEAQSSICDSSCSLGSTASGPGWLSAGTIRGTWVTHVSLSNRFISASSHVYGNRDAKNKRLSPVHKYFISLSKCHICYCPLATESHVCQPRFERCR